MLKPMLARGEIHTIGATTLKEYKNSIEKDGALERRFQKVMVLQPTVEDTISILRGIKENTKFITELGSLMGQLLLRQVFQIDILQIGFFQIRQST